MYNKIYINVSNFKTHSPLFFESDFSANNDNKFHGEHKSWTQFTVKEDIEVFSLSSLFTVHLTDLADFSPRSNPLAVLRSNRFTFSLILITVSCLSLTLFQRVLFSSVFSFGSMWMFLVRAD